jgi:2-keto-4-pentenoate hydratase/2-oxohepta-3-ene-1,7-dioic acid hydratase in catechol pathway
MLVHVSREEDVYPCDVYGSGTPGGCCGVDLGRRLRPGDRIRLEALDLGLLDNTVEQPTN